RAACDAVLQGEAVQILHDHEGDALILPNLVNHADIGMAESRGSLRFALEAGQSVWVSGQRFGQELHGDETMQDRVFSLVDHAHAAATKLFNNAVMRDKLADHGGERRRALSRDDRRGSGGKSMFPLAFLTGFVSD